MTRKEKRDLKYRPFSEWRYIWQNTDIPCCFIQGQIDKAEEESFNDDDMIINPRQYTNGMYPIRWACASFASYL
jgi:hypothetical protein